jgi:hypothetical protein
MDQNWITRAEKFTDPYLRGVTELMEFVRQHVKEDDGKFCPHCVNIIRHNQNTIETHINYNGMTMTYIRWIFHGEAFSDDQSEGAYESDHDEFDEGNINDDGVNSMVDDLEESGQ